MNDQLNNGINYDKSRLNDMQMFLNHILSIARSNPLMEITSSMVYNELKNWNIKSYDKNEYGRGKKVDYLFPEWMNSFRNVGGIDVFRTENFKYWCQFTNAPYFNEYIKLYIPIDGAHLKDGVSQLFNFLARNGIEHASKVGTELRSDNVIIRLKKGDTASLNKIINYINNNRYLREGMNPVNPFVPTINGIGVMNDSGISYNDEMSKVITSYITEHRLDSKINLNDFIESAKSLIYLDEVRDTFEIAANKRGQAFDRKPNKQKELSEIQKQSLLFDTVKATIDKYDITQAQVALKNAIKNSYFGNFTNGNKGYRNMLSKNVSGSEILFFIKKSLPNIGNDSLDFIIQSYCAFVYNNRLIEYFDNMCRVTMENHGKTFLCDALRQYYLTNNPTCFSRYRKDSDDKINYRDYCKYFNGRNIPQILAVSLLTMGVRCEKQDLMDTIYQYTNTLEGANYSVTR